MLVNSFNFVESSYCSENDQAYVKSFEIHVEVLNLLVCLLTSFVFLSNFAKGSTICSYLDIFWFFEEMEKFSEKPLL